MVEITNNYEVYKDSGVEWLGQIPEHWEISKFKRLFVEKKKTTNVELNCGSISFGKIVYKDDERIPESTKRSYQVLSKGDFLINPLNLNYDLISLRIALSEIDVVVSSGYIILNNRVKLDKNYYKWLLHIFDVVFMKTLGAGVRQTLSFTHLANCELVYPPLREQIVIATFLDDKTAKIEQAIAIKEQQIAMLKERKQIIIQEAVTKGLDKTVKLKDSGVEWIGMIPEHWEVKRLKNLIQNLESGVSVNASESESAKEHEIGVLKTSAVYKYSFDKSENKKVFINDINRVSCPVRKGRIIISRMNAPDLVGASGFVHEDYPNLYLPDRLWQTVFNPAIEFYSYWLSLILINKSFRTIVTSLANGSSPSMKNISKPDYLNIYIPFPNFHEQYQIASHIDSQSSKIDQAVSIKEQEIEKLKEYRMSLIDTVVTGKVKVC